MVGDGEIKPEQAQTMPHRRQVSVGIADTRESMVDADQAAFAAACSERSASLLV